MTAPICESYPRFDLPPGTRRHEDINPGDTGVDFEVASDPPAWLVNPGEFVMKEPAATMSACITTPEPVNLEQGTRLAPANTLPDGTADFGIANTT